jgi:hypothetical protein
MTSPSTLKRTPEEINLLTPPHKKSRISIIDLQNDDSSSSDDSNSEIQIIHPPKRVHFDDIEHEVYYFKPYPVEFIDETTPTKSSSKRTADYTVLSSQHGRARRALRNISKRDLQAAMKYGVKTPTVGNRGQPCWKFTYNNVVYITDYSCRHEITSYTEALRIDRHPISNEMMTKHHEIKSLIENQPHLCTGHTYIIVDHSGSMRQSDVNGFHNRSAAAYGILALDFIAEQLSEGSDLLESVSVIEMRDEGELILDRQPFDWILFNSLLRRGCESVPRSHGNYNPSLLLVQQLIVKEYNLLRDKMEKEDLPNFNMVFLSDGRPSDGYQNHQSVVDVQRFNAQRIEVLTSLSTLLRDKFSLFAMGVGASFMEFQALSEMVDTVKPTVPEDNLSMLGWMPLRWVRL